MEKITNFDNLEIGQRVYHITKYGVDWYTLIYREPKHPDYMFFKTKCETGAVRLYQPTVMRDGEWYVGDYDGKFLYGRYQALLQEKVDGLTDFIAKIEC